MRSSYLLSFDMVSWLDKLNIKAHFMHSV